MSGHDAEIPTLRALAGRVGVPATVLRAWQRQFGFPEAVQHSDGTRTYDESHVDAVREVMLRRAAGATLEEAIAQTAARSDHADQPTSPSVFAELRTRHPHLEVLTLPKPVLVDASRAIEDAVLTRSVRAHLFGAFQRQEFFEPSRARWRRLAGLARSTFAFADFPRPSALGGPVEVPLPERAPMLREWAVVCDAPDLMAALSAWELPGQDDLPDHERAFQTVWTLDPPAVRDAARMCAFVAHDAGVDGLGSVVFDLAGPPPDLVPALGLEPTLSPR